jgi:hypothetical protein
MDYSRSRLCSDTSAEAAYQEREKMLKSKVIILGRAIPLWLLLLAFLAVGAGAAYIGHLFGYGHGTGSTMGIGADVELISVGPCNGGSPGTVTCTFVDSENFTYDIQGVNDESVINLSDIRFRNNGDLPAEFCSVSGWTYGTMLPLDTPKILSPLGGEGTVGAQLYFESTVANQDLTSDLTFTWASEGNCP